MKKIQETFNRHLEEVKSNQTVMTNTITKIKNTLDGVSSRIAGGKEWQSELEDRMIEITTKEQNKGEKIEKKLRTVSETLGQH